MRNGPLAQHAQARLRLRPLARNRLQRRGGKCVVRVMMRVRVMERARRGPQMELVRVRRAEW